MIIRTSNEQSLVNCCPCDFPSCEAPSVSCESISIDACGYSLPYNVSIATADLCKLYKTKSDTEVRALHYNTDGTNYSNDETNTEVSEMFGLSCIERLVSRSHNLDESNAYTPEGDESPSSDINVTQVSTTDSNGVCTGTETYTDNIDSGNNYTNSFPYDVPLAFEPDGTWSYSAGVYTYSFPPGVYDSLIWTTAYSNLVTRTSLLTDLDSVISTITGPWPDDGCIAITHNTSLSGCDQIDSVTKSRYRYGVPANFSSLSATRSTWEMQWQEVFFPSLSSESPSLVANRSWIWDGNMDHAWSDWYVIDPPSSPGEVRRVNLLVKCYNSTRFGVKPTSHGEVVVL